MMSVCFFLLRTGFSYSLSTAQSWMQAISYRRAPRIKHSQNFHRTVKAIRLCDSTRKRRKTLTTKRLVDKPHGLRIKLLKV
jgi:hypothetical protein